MMKNTKIIVGVLVIIIVLMIVFSFFYLSFPQSKKTDRPEAKIEIKMVESGDIIVHPGDLIFFSAKNSTDDGRIEEYEWDFDDGNTSNTMEPVHEYDEPGVYYVTLTVVDDDGDKNVTTVSITVMNSLPVAIAGIENHPAPKSGKIPIYHSIKFNSMESFDTDGEIIEWVWDFGDGSYSSEQNPKHQYDSLGYFNISLTITDNYDGSATTYLDVKIVLRTYQIEWILEQTEEILEPNGYTLESESAKILHQVTQEQIAKINAILNWTDYQPFLKNNQSQGNDTFELLVVTPENQTLQQNSTTGNITIPVKYISGLNTEIYEAETKNEAITNALNDAKFSDGGQGEWSFNVNAIECKGGSWSDDIFDLDIGNFWSLKVIYFYYDIIITDISYDQYE